MDSQKLLALASTIEHATNMDHFFRATHLPAGTSLPPAGTGLRVFFDAQTTPQSVPTLKFYVFDSGRTGSGGGVGAGGAGGAGVVAGGKSGSGRFLDMTDLLHISPYRLVFFSSFPGQDDAADTLICIPR